MKNIFFIALVILIAVCFNGCEAIGDIFQAGIWSGVLLVTGIIVVIIFLIARNSNKN